MKKILIGCLISIFLISCSDKKFKLIICNGNSVLPERTFIYCDSFQMISDKEADVFVDGDTIRVKSTVGIYPESN